MAAHRAVIKTAEQWRRLLRAEDAAQPLSDGPRGQDCERRRFHRLIAMGERLGVPVGVIVESRPRQRVCAYAGCGQPFVAIAATSPQKFCSGQCAARARYGPRREPRLCPACGQTFPPLAKTQQTCGAACGLVMRAIRKKEAVSE